MKIKELPFWLKSGILASFIPLILYLLQNILFLSSELFHIKLSGNNPLTLLIGYLVLIFIFIVPLFFTFPILFSSLISKESFRSLHSLMFNETGSGEAVFYILTIVGLIFNMLFWFLIGAIFGIIIKKMKLNKKWIIILLAIILLIFVLLIGRYFI